MLQGSFLPLPEILHDRSVSDCLVRVTALDPAISDDAVEENSFCI